jgi:hypothetical protein
VLNRLMRSARGYYYYNDYSAYYTDKVETLDPVQTKRSKESGDKERTNQHGNHLLDKDRIAQPSMNGVYQIQHEKSDL